MACNVKATCGKQLRQPVSPSTLDTNLGRDREECVTYLSFPRKHHHRIRTTNRLERLQEQWLTRKRRVEAEKETGPISEEDAEVLPSLGYIR